MRNIFYIIAIVLFAISLLVWKYTDYDIIAFAIWLLDILLLIGNDSLTRELVLMKKEEFRAVIVKTRRIFAHEKHNFEKLLCSDRNYNSSLHKKAVEQYSFEKVRDTLTELRAFKFQRRKIDRILDEINNQLNTENKQTKLLLKLIEKLERKIN